MKNFKYKYQKDKFLRENLNPDADKRTIKEHLEKQNKGLIILGTLIAIIFLVWAYFTLKTYE